VVRGAAPLCAQRTVFLAALAVANLVGLLALGVVPGSPGHLRATTWAAVGLAATAVVVVIRPHRLGVAGQSAAVAALTAGLALALAGGDSGVGADLYTVWFPWIGIFGGLAPSLPQAVANAALISTGLVAGMDAIGELGPAAPGVQAAVVSTWAATLLVHGLASWSSTQVGRDPLTSLANRGGLLREANAALASSLARGGRVILVLLDVKRFREVNDALGHTAGDQLLRLIARQLEDVTPEPMFLGRLGSDEFALVMSGAHLADSPAAAREQLQGLGHAVLGQIRGPFRVNEVPVEVEASVGIAVAPHDGATLSALLPCADAALFRAKRDGERVGLADVAMAGVRPWEIALYAELRAAIGRGELTVHYQILQAAQTGRVAGVEALLRWNHPSRGLLPPGAFLPMAERSELIVDVTAWVLDEALRQCASWERAGLAVPVSVNLSARMLVVGDLPNMVAAQLARHGLPGDVLTLEITESALVTQPERAAALLRELREQGVQLSLDDFGTGYSSMEILKTLPFDEVKIDKGFVSDARGSLPDAAIVRTVLDLGHRLGLRVVGEGVEDAETLAMMIELGCDIVQGDVLSKPLPPAELGRILEAGTCTPALTGEAACEAGSGDGGVPGDGGAVPAGAPEAAVDPVADVTEDVTAGAAGDRPCAASTMVTG
jgi:diguanylate cyclase (GGDEF)-like protein